MRYESLTAYLKTMDPEKIGKWTLGKEIDGARQLPYVIYEQQIHDFCHTFEPFMDHNYQETIARSPIELSLENLIEPNLFQTLTAEEVIGLLTYVIRSEHFVEGSLEKFAKDGWLTASLKRLQAIDEKNQRR